MAEKLESNKQALIEFLFLFILDFTKNLGISDIFRIFSWHSGKLRVYLKQFVYFDALYRGSFEIYKHYKHEDESESHYYLLNMDNFLQASAPTQGWNPEGVVNTPKFDNETHIQSSKRFIISLKHLIPGTLLLKHIAKICVKIRIHPTRQNTHVGKESHHSQSTRSQEVYHSV